jgi:hypothetical protein
VEQRAARGKVVDNLVRANAEWTWGSGRSSVGPGTEGVPVADGGSDEPGSADPCGHGFPTWNTRRRRFPRARAAPAVVLAAADPCRLGRCTWNIRSCSRASMRNRADPERPGGRFPGPCDAASAANAVGPADHSATLSDRLHEPSDPLQAGFRVPPRPLPALSEIAGAPYTPPVDAASRSHSNAGVPFHLRY